MFLLEAMGRGNCVVSTDVGGVAEVLADGRGLVAAPDDVVAFRTALQSVLSDAALRDRLADAAREAYEKRYSAEAVFPQVEELWLDALADRRSTRGRDRMREPSGSARDGGDVTVAGGGV